MGRHPLGSQGWHFRGRRLHVLLQLEPHTGSSKRMPVTVDENGLIFGTWVSLQKILQQRDCFGPERTNAFFSPFAKQTNLERRLQPQSLGQEVQRLLNTGAR